ncbi:hypothetical protein LTR86_000871 [Recurvomyces mirabilis]|nr:hypothetical protein LTR86_000871 [Recurvomyces mirabilis]
MSDASSENHSDVAHPVQRPLMELDPAQDSLHEVGEIDDEEEEGVPDDEEPEVFPPPGLKEISSLASWTVSTAKPGNGVAALRSPDPAHFWQSDGPQPHLLSIHFFKLVSVVSIQVLLDFDNDESYTPTKIQFLAGMGVHDIQEFAEMTFEQPNGWHDVDFSNVGPVEQDDDDEDDEARSSIDWSKRPVLRAFLVQVRILENHQNGKDTHLRGVRIFARDEMHQADLSGGSRPPSDLPVRPHNHLQNQAEQNNLKLASWMQEPDLR